MIFIFTGKKSLVLATTCLELIPKADWKNEKAHEKKRQVGAQHEGEKYKRAVKEKEKDRQ